MFGERLKIARKQKGLTLDQLAELYNKKFEGKMSKGTLSKYEHGKQEPMANVVVKLATILGVPVDYLYVDTPINEKNLADESKAFDIVSEVFGEDAAELLNAYSKLNEIGKKKALETVTDFSEITKYTD